VVENGGQHSLLRRKRLQRRLPRAPRFRPGPDNPGGFQPPSCLPHDCPARCAQSAGFFHYGFATADSRVADDTRLIVHRHFMSHILVLPVDYENTAIHHMIHLNHEEEGQGLAIKAVQGMFPPSARFLA
jgi:hypothetical protein